MRTIERRSLALRSHIRGELKARFPVLSGTSGQKQLPRPRVDPSAIVLGRTHTGEPLTLPLKARLEHAQLIGTTGGGKTKLLEHCIRQDIAEGRGVCVIDPHGNHPGSLYRSLLQWLHERGYDKTRTIHLIDPNAGTHVTGLDPLSLPSADYDFSVVAEAMQEALEKVWGEEDMNAKPTMQRVLSAVLSALTELKLTLAEARHLFDPFDRHGIRAWAIAKVTDPDVKEELQWLSDIAAGQRGAQDFRQEVTGPRNRLAKLTRNPAVRAMVGQKEIGIDFRAALDEGHIILANLSPGPRASDKAVQLLGRLLTRMLFFHCQRRTRPELPFFFYLDECQLYLSGDVSRFLAESRKYGMGVVLASQYLAQYDSAGTDIREAVKNATNVKIVFRIKDADEAASLADLVVPYDLEVPVRSLVKPTVVGQRLVRLKSDSRAEQRSVTEAVSESEGYGYSRSRSVTQGENEGEGESTSSGESETASDAESASQSLTVGESQGQATALAFSGQSASPQGMTLSMSHERQLSRSTGHSMSSAHTRGSSSGSSNSRFRSVSSSVSDSVSATRSRATATSRGETRGSANTAGSAEAFEPIYEDRPTAVHNLENMRYRAATALRHLTAGKAAVSFVDSTGMKTAALTVARVETIHVPDEAFVRLRTDIFANSPSAVPYEKAIQVLEARERALMTEAGAVMNPDGDDPATFRTKKIRPKKRNGSAVTHEVQ